jgi:hypothetical protein
MSDIFWILGMYALFIIVGAAFIGMIGAIAMAIVFPALLVGMMV